METNGTMTGEEQKPYRDLKSVESVPARLPEPTGRSRGRRRRDLPGGGSKDVWQGREWETAKEEEEKKKTAGQRERSKLEGSVERWFYSSGKCKLVCYSSLRGVSLGGGGCRVQEEGCEG